MFQFRKNYVLLLQSLCKKLQEKSPLKSLVVRSAASLSPQNMREVPEYSKEMFEKLADTLFEKKWITEAQCDSAKAQYEQFVGKEVIAEKEKFCSFNLVEDRLDHFLVLFVKKPEYKSLWYICKIIFVLSHGQSQVERGFNINKDALAINMERDSLKARRMVYDEMKSTQVKVPDFVIEPGLIQSCKSSHSRYITNLNSKRDEEATKVNSKKRKLLQDELLTVQQKKNELERRIKCLRSDIEDYSIQAGKQEDFEEMRTLLTKANCFRDCVKEKLKSLENLEEATKRLEKEIKSI